MTHDQIYEKLLIIESSLLEMRTGMVRLEALPARLDDHEKRLRVIEEYTNKARGAVATSALLGGLVSGAVIAALQLLLGT